MIRLNKVEASKLARREVELSERDPGSAQWISDIEHFSELCEQSASKTHIAFLGTVLLAKAVNSDVDLFAIKPRHAEGRDAERSFSARTLCHGVLVPLAAEFGIDMGVSGREPLNNQPYFRMTRLDDGTPVHPGGRIAFDYMLGLVRKLQILRDKDEIQGALRAFISVRRKYQPRYAEVMDGVMNIPPQFLTRSIVEFVRLDSEGGKRAQAVAAGVLDVFAGTDRVVAGRVNDPSRRYPGDVCVLSRIEPRSVLKAFEVRDKLVTETDVQLFAKKCIHMGVRDATVLMVDENQLPVDEITLNKWAGEFGIGLTLFQGWSAFVQQALFWGDAPIPISAGLAVSAIHRRLVQIEVSPGGVEDWIRLTIKTHK
jgi:hypothetical protein